jgi:hypothetical protein
MGTHSINVHGSIVKNKLDKSGKIIGREEYKKAKLTEEQAERNKGNDEEMPQLEKVIKEMEDQEGCQLYGYFYVNKVPGNFHISAHAYGSVVQQLISLGYYDFSVSHTVNSLSFGEKLDIYKIKQSFTEGSLNPLDGIVKKDNKRNVYEYYLKVITI